METFDKNKYERAKKRVKEIKGFYSHLSVYFVVNCLLLLLQMGVFRHGFMDFDYPTWPMFTTPFFWGIGLAFHALYVFKDSFGFLRNWEERKIREFMEEEETDLQKNFDEEETGRNY